VSTPKPEPEVIRAKVMLIIAELSAGLRKHGLSAEEVASIATEAEKDASERASLSKDF
jgi:hypothetical protein